MILFITKVQVGETEREFITGMLDDYSSLPKYVGLGTLLSEPKYYNILTMIDGVDIGYTVDDEIVLPVIEGYDMDAPEFDRDDIVYLEDPYDVKSLGDMVLFESDEFDTLDEVLEQAIPNYNSREFKSMCLSSSDTIDSLVNYKFRYNLNRKVDADIRAVADKYNSESKVTGVTSTKMNTSNITLPMETPDSELYVQIPKPYYSKNMITEDDVSVDFVDLGTVYAALNPYNDNADASNPVNFKNAISEFGKEAILGDSKNNDLPIQNNERRFYTALNRFIERSLKMYLEAENMYSEEEFNRRINNNVLPTHIELILESFVKAFVNINWRHSPNVPVNEFIPPSEAGEDDDDDGKGGDSSQLSGEYAASSDVSAISKGNDITHYMTSIKSLLSNNLTAYAWSEAIVKLARWGNRKPTHLKFTEEESGSSLTMLNLFKFEGEEDLSYLRNYDCVKVGGCDYILASLVVNDAMYVADSTGMIEDAGVETYGDASMCSAGVLGVRCLQTFDTSHGTKRVNVYMSLDSIIDNYSKDINKIYGVDIVDGKFVVSEEVMQHLGASMKVTDVKSVTMSKPEKNILITSPKVFECLQSHSDFSLSNSFDYSLFGFVPMVIPEVNLRDMLSKERLENSSVAFYIAKKFNCDMQYMYLPQTDKGTLESALNIYKELYGDVDFTNQEVSVLANEGDSMSATSLFQKAEVEQQEVVNKLDPIFKLVIGEDNFYICKLDAPNEVGCDKLFTSKENIVDLNKPFKQVSGMPAVNNASVIGFRNRQRSYKDKIYAEDVCIDKLEETLLKTYKADINAVIRNMQKK